MLRRLLLSSLFTQASLLTSATFLFLAFGVPPSVNIVLNTYGLAAFRVLHHVSPYLMPTAGTPVDIFKYSPIFAVGFGGIVHLSALFPIPQTVALPYLWTLISAFLFWLGVCRWFDFREPGPWWMGLALVGAFIELDTSLWYCQANALVLGVTLIGLAEFRDNRKHTAGWILAFATGLKILPVLFAVALCFGGGSRYRKGLFLGALVVFFLPCLFTGLGAGLRLHQEWVSLLLRDTTSPGVLDLGSVFSLYHLPRLGLWLRTLILLLSFGLLVGFSAVRLSAYDSWISLGLSALILCSPRTEQPTFVLMAPAYLFLARQTRKTSRGAVIAAAVILISLRSWRLVAPHLPHGEYKTLGTLVLWGVSLGYLAPILRQAFFSPGANSPIHGIDVGITHLLNRVRRQS